ncbi:MarR family winged helix-turn-helix transcriptional regulator [Dokdonia sp.]|uniref:MarR family winged helix-turn-helix transcriptional regulator n=1 Tax=Dokdonia sp. TaxID=2024995 RepID=UPI00326650A7
MKKTIFNTAYQNDTANKVVVGLERISEAFKVLLWEHAKVVGLSPIQIQILLFIAHHKLDMCTVSYLAQEFNITKPTISDAVKALLKKELIQKKTVSTDSRSYAIALTPKGKTLLLQIEDFALPIKDQLEHIDQAEVKQLYHTITKLIHGLNKSGILSIQRNCHSCIFYEKKAKSHYCNFLKQPLENHEIRLDCPEYESKPTGTAS